VRHRSGAAWQHGHIFIGGGLGAVSRTRAARHPERHAVSQRQAGPDVSAAPAGPPRASRSLDAAALRQLAAMALDAADEPDELAAEAACQH
jgi:hypothetical protein